MSEAERLSRRSRYLRSIAHVIRIINTLLFIVSLISAFAFGLGFSEFLIDGINELDSGSAAQSSTDVSVAFSIAATVFVFVTQIMIHLVWYAIAEAFMFASDMTYTQLNIIYRLSERTADKTPTKTKSQRASFPQSLYSDKKSDEKMWFWE